MSALAFAEVWNLASLLTIAILALVLLLLAGLHRRMSTMERIIRQIALDFGSSVPRAGETKAKASLDEGAYLQFLAENPDKRGLLKSELFAEYRKWRKSKGLTWGG